MLWAVLDACLKANRDSEGGVAGRGYGRGRLCRHWLGGRFRAAREGAQNGEDDNVAAGNAERKGN